eukprot:TRINITY_DN18357_c0_g1_i1.p2 TRINITY_DN18357_c0_g1~~TRINITY_DN18357_c0_g1_i1.p2  ORF type:complete len:182 (+),score=52.08 TRINITY_DN18357_c0_g1_i1:96-641(+)
MTTAAEVVGAATAAAESALDGILADTETPLPKGVEGTMDGTRPPATKLEEIKAKLEPVKARLAPYLGKLRPWREFVRVSKPEGDLKQRLEANLVHFQINYVIIYLLQLIFMIVTNPSCLVVLAVLGIVWAAFLRKNEDPSWEVTVAGLQLNKTHRVMALGAISAIVLLSVVGQAAPVVGIL